MAELAMNEPDDARLRQLLVTERRLQDLVRNAAQNAEVRVAEARAACERRLSASREEAARADAERARAEHASHEAALSALHSAHQVSLAAIIQVSDERVDELARRVLARAIARTGEPA